jgi:very-short-patch-repair endonuclease
LNYQVEKALNDINIKFTKEYIISMRYVDYYIEELNLIIEVDGDIHYDGVGQIK